MSMKITETPENFANLVGQIQQADHQLTHLASKAVNISLTLRNWLIGYYIAEYQLQGKDRADYGDKLFERLAQQLKQQSISRVDSRELRRYKQFYQTYPYIRESLTPEFTLPLLKTGDTVSQIQTDSKSEWQKNILNRLSFSHIIELIAIEDDTKRQFYELEAIQANWSVRELKRQIASLYYERSGLSLDKAKLQQLTHQASKQNSEQNAPGLVIRDPYVFEFLGLKPQEVMSESHLEGELINKLEDFMLELGHGFCFEAKQKRILIGDEHYFVDLVFYHRILKCHVLIDLKLETFNHSNIGQLNTYVSWYKANMMSQGDNPPIGILLCTDKNHALVEYALAGMDNQLFVSKYQLELPKPETMQAFIEQQMQQLAQSE
jgi:predicted nuclease of restriction endonuclease-like (RecB) superfamily